MPVLGFCNAHHTKERNLIMTEMFWIRLCNCRNKCLSQKTKIGPAAHPPQQQSQHHAEISIHSMFCLLEIRVVRDQLHLGQLPSLLFREIHIHGHRDLLSHFVLAASHNFPALIANNFKLLRVERNNEVQVVLLLLARQQLTKRIISNSNFKLKQLSLVPQCDRYPASSTALAGPSPCARPPAPTRHEYNTKR